MSLYKKLLTVQNSMPKIDKDSYNPHFRSKYSSLSNVLNTVLPILNAQGIYHTNQQNFIDGKWVLEVKLIDADTSEEIKTILPLLNVTDMQKMGGCITYAQRYGLLPLLGIAPELDDDGNSVSLPERPDKKESDDLERVKLCEELNVLLKKDLPKNDRLTKIIEAADKNYVEWSTDNIKKAIVFVKEL